MSERTFFSRHYQIVLLWSALTTSVEISLIRLTHDNKEFDVWFSKWPTATINSPRSVKQVSFDLRRKIRAYKKTFNKNHRFDEDQQSLGCAIKNNMTSREAIMHCSVAMTLASSVSSD
jgi:hypothetical protein